MVLVTKQDVLKNCTSQNDTCYKRYIFILYYYCNAPNQYQQHVYMVCNAISGQLNTAELNQPMD
jgi:hypothetical protein